MIALDRNESYWLLDDELLTAMRSDASDFSTYPSYEALKVALSAYAGVPPDHILITPGSDAAIEHIARTFGSAGDVLLPVPTFYGYETILDRIHATVIPLVYEEKKGEFLFPIDATIAACSKRSAKILFLCNPNNPLGSSLSHYDIEALIATMRERDCLLVSDEAYHEFSRGESFLPFVREFPNIVILRTLSKAFGLAGARVGYVIAQPQIIERLERQLLPWPIAHTSVSAALALLTRRTHVEDRRSLLSTVHKQFASALCEIPETIVYDTQTNFVLVRVRDARQVHALLLRQGISVALGEPMTRFPESKEVLRNTLRIAIPSPTDISVVIHALSQVTRV